MPLTLQFYTRKECSLCQSALAVVKRVQQRIFFELEVIDIESDPGLRALYVDVIPVVTQNKTELARSFVDEKKLFQAVQKSGLEGQKTLFSRSLDIHKP